MKTATKTNEQFIWDAITRQLKLEVDALINDAVIDIQNKLKDRVDAIALKTLKHYDMSTMGDQLVIKVIHLDTPNV